MLNPRFTQYLLKLLGHEGRPAEAMEAYEYRLKGLETPPASASWWESTAECAVKIWADLFPNRSA